MKRPGQQPRRSLRPWRALRPGRAFTLVELLTVIALIAVLASLLLTGVASAKKKSRSALCSSNLHQVSLAINLYADETSAQPEVAELKRGHYLSTGALLCPEDRTYNWGLLLQSPPRSIQPTNSGSKNFSYLLHPLVWDAGLWKRLLSSGNEVGLGACQLHGLGQQTQTDARSFTGLLLRAQRDGAVVRRQLFWNWTLEQMPNLPAGATNKPYLYPLPVYMDNPLEWLQKNP